MIDSGRIVKGYLGGTYEDLGLFEHKEDAERGINADLKLYELFEDYSDCKLEIIIKVLEE